MLQKYTSNYTILKDTPSGGGGVLHGLNASKGDGSFTGQLGLFGQSGLWIAIAHQEKQLCPPLRTVHIYPTEPYWLYTVQ